MNRRMLRYLAMGAALALGVAACSSDDDDDPVTAGDDGGDGGDGGELATVPGFDGETITVGMLSPLSDAVAVIGGPLSNGHVAYYEAVNAAGGVAGQYPIEYAQGDITYIDTSTTAREYDRLKDEVVLFSQILGTPHISEVLPQLEADGVTAAPATLDAEWVGEPNLIPVGAPYQFQVMNSVDYYVNELGSADDTICIAANDTEYGDAGIEGMEFAAENLGFEVAAAPRHSQGDTDFTPTIGALQEAQCDMVFVTSLPAETGTILGTAAATGFATQWILQSPAYIGQFAGGDLLPYLEANVLIAAEGTEWGDESVPGMAQMVSDLEEFVPEQDPDYYFGFGYVQAQTVVALLEKAVELGDLSREGIQNALVELGTVTHDGLSGEYEYGEERVPPRSTTIFQIEGGRPFGVANLERDYKADFADDFEV